jgi:lysozyme family protein
MRILLGLLAALVRKCEPEPPTAEEMYDTRPDAFYPAVELILKHEGGYVNHPSDPGGETNWGISKRAYPQLDIKNLSRNDAIAIYRRDYWERCRCDELPGAMALSVFDFAVNAGVRRAIITLQRSIGVRDDGILGPITMTHAKQSDRGAVIRYAELRISFYRGLKTWATFGRGWTARTDETLSEALKLCD